MQNTDVTITVGEDGFVAYGCEVDVITISPERQQQQSPQQQSPPDYPKWWDKWTSNPKKRVYYGYGFARIRKDAIKKARAEVGGELKTDVKTASECVEKSTQETFSSNQREDNWESGNKKECGGESTANSRETLEGAVVKKSATIKGWTFVAVKYVKPKHVKSTLPKWWDKWTSNPKKRVYYGYGFAETRQKAVDEARGAVIGELESKLKKATGCITQETSSSNQGGGNRESGNKEECQDTFTSESDATLEGAVVKKRATVKGLEFVVIEYKKPKSKR